MKLRVWPVFLVLALAVLLAVFGVRKPGDRSLYPARDGDAVTVWVVDNGYHSNVVVERVRLERPRSPLSEAARALPPGPYVALGWGDRRFFTESGFSFRRALDGLRALFALNNRSVVMLEPLRDRPDRLWSSGVVPIRLSGRGLDAMLARVEGSLILDPDGRAVPGPRGPNPDARFFESRERFGVFKLCNHWTAGLLSAAGVPIRPVMDTWGSALAFDLKTWALTLEPAET